MRKILIFVLLASYANAQMIISQEMIKDGILSGVAGVFKEATGQNDEVNEKKCQKEYTELYERHSGQLSKVRQDNVNLKRLIRMNSIKYEEVKINHIPIIQHKKCIKKYWNYQKSSSHDIAQLNNENINIKTILTKNRINYAPLLKRKNIAYEPNEESTSTSERQKAKEELKRQMGF